MSFVTPLRPYGVRGYQTVEVKTMLDNLLHNHDLPVVGPDGQLTTRRATCAEAERHHAPHVSPDLVPDGQGGQKLGIQVINCHTAEAERQELMRLTTEQAATIARLNGENTDKDGQLANYERLMSASLPVIFRLGPALQGLLAENIDHPAMTDDGTAVKLDSVQFTVLVLPFREKVTVRAIGCDVPDRSFDIVNGRVTPDDQTSMIGHIGRIRRTLETGTDPVVGAISLTDTVAATA